MFLSIGSGTRCIIISNGWKTEATYIQVTGNRQVNNMEHYRKDRYTWQIDGDNWDKSEDSRQQRTCTSAYSLHTALFWLPPSWIAAGVRICREDITKIYSNLWLSNNPASLISQHRYLSLSPNPGITTLRSFRGSGAHCQSNYIPDRAYGPKHHPLPRPYQDALSPFLPFSCLDYDFATANLSPGALCYNRASRSLGAVLLHVAF